jgi:prepilin-type processing-associated H-X9-DG protein
MRPTTRDDLGRAGARAAGITLVEVVVVLCGLSLLAALVLAGTLRARAAAERAACASNLRQMAMAVHHYSDAFGRLPTGCQYRLARAGQLPPPGVGLSWQTAILPYVEQDGLWLLATQAQREDPWGRLPIQQEIRAHVIRVYLCPADGRATDDFPEGEGLGLTDYVGVAGTGVYKNDGIFHVQFTVRLSDITDGCSNTLLIGERPPGPDGAFGGWYSAWGTCCCPVSQILPAVGASFFPTVRCGDNPAGLRPGEIDDVCDVTHFWSLHTGGANFAFADGSVHFLPYGDSDVLRALATRAGGENVVDY